MEVKIKKLSENAVIPTYAKSGDAGMDLVATSKEYDTNGNVVYGTGLAFEIPEGYVGLIFPRSSNAKTRLILSNSTGVIDSGFRGEVLFKYKQIQHEYLYLDRTNEYNIGDRIGQIIIMPYPKIEFKEVEVLSNTERGKGGYGSTGR